MFERVIMSPPTFMTLPREIRDIVYRFVWDHAPPSGVTSALPYREQSRRKLYPFDRFPADVTLALLHVSRQVSAEAALTFYGKRTFYLDPLDVVPFLNGFSHRLALIKDIEVTEGYLNFSQTYSKAFAVLSTLEGPQSFAMSLDTLFARNRQFERVLERLTALGIHHVIDRMNVTVRLVGEMRLGYTEGCSKVIELTDTWTCAKGESHWKKRGLHCRAYNRDMLLEGHERPFAQPCDHEDHQRMFFDS